MMRDIVPYFGLIALLPFIDRSFHGPSRVMERQLAFDVTKSYKLQLYHAAIHLPMSWHTDNHTGTTIDKISKAT